jgi:hypothetical protein
MKNARWMWYPDNQSSVDWRTLQDCIRNKKHQCIADLFNTTPDFEKIDLTLRPVESHKYPFVQVADLFAGLGAYSWGQFDRFASWKRTMSGAQELFSQEKVDFTNSEKQRFPILLELKEKCRNRDLKIALESSKGLKSHNPQKYINFWFYEPQHKFDRAPSKIK